jgi:hypothetical protein
MSECGKLTSSEGNVSADALWVSPTEVRLDTCSLCQLNCVLCPVGHRKGRPFMGRGMLPLDHFVDFIDSNPQIQSVEIGNAGEAFLNPELPAMMKYAYEKGVDIHLKQGSNLNDVSDEALEGLVKYGVSLVKVSIDGATQETYQKYRVGGDLRKVLNNVRKINEFKNQYRSRLPRLILQFIPFGHNEHEMSKIMVMAQALDMELFFKINVFKGNLPLRNHEALTKLLGYHDMNSYLEKTGKIYMRNVCLQLWRSPQISWDGRLLGCSHNVRGMYAENALNGRFASEINNERMQHARKMLMGIAPARKDIPCTACEVFADFQRYDQWFTPEEIKAAMDCQHPHMLALDDD